MSYIVCDGLRISRYSILDVEIAIRKHITEYKTISDREGRAWVLLQEDHDSSYKNLFQALGWTIEETDNFIIPIGCYDTDTYRWSDLNLVRDLVVFSVCSCSCVYFHSNDKTATQYFYDSQHSFYETMGVVTYWQEGA
jgi:hypothetical protein